MSEPTILFVNQSDSRVNLGAIGLPSIEPKGEIDVPISLAAAGRTAAGARAKSSIEHVAPQMRPKHEADLAVWMAVPPLPTPESKIVTVSARSPNEAPGIKALRELAESKKKIVK